MKLKLLQKIFLILIIPALVAGSISGYIAVVSVRYSLINSITQTQLVNTKEMMANIDRVLYERYLNIQLIGSSVPIRNFLNQKAAINDVKPRIDDFLQLTGPWYDLDLVNNEGTVVYSSDEVELGDNVKDETNDQIAFSRAQAGETYYSDLILSGENKTPTILFSTPIIDQNRVIGVVIGRYAWPVILEILETSGFDRAALYNKNGEFMGSNDRSEIPDILSDMKMKHADTSSAMESSGIASKQVNGKSQQFLDTYAKSKGYLVYLGNNWHLLIESRADKIFNPANQIAFNQLFLIILVLLFFIVLFLILTYRFIIKPIYKLTKGAEAVAGGDLSQHVAINSNDEIGLLAEAFNYMSGQLKESYSQLEDRIKEKTKQLSETVAKLSKNNEELEKSKKSILNVAEDAEQEKELSVALAKDLEKFKLAVDNTSDHIVITDADGIILFANHGVELITGYSPSEVLGKKSGSKELWGGLMDKEFYAKLWKTIKIDKKAFIGEINNRKKNGELYTAMASISPIINEAGKVEFFVAIERDITKEKQIDKAKTEFVSLASHQLRTPLSAINWYAEMLMAGDAGTLNEEQKKYVDEIYRGNQRMVELVNALLNVSRIDLGTFAIEPQPTDFAEIAKSVLSELKPQLSRKSLILTEEYDPNLPQISADPKLVRIIIQNLLTNSVKYTPEKGRVGISLTKDKKDIKLTVTDSGYGIPEAAKDKIFTKLYRADNVRERDTEGTGLGLYLVKSVVEQSGGKIWFDSVEGKGTEFYVTIPLSGMKKKAGTKELSPGK